MDRLKRPVSTNVGVEKIKGNAHSVKVSAGCSLNTCTERSNTHQQPSCTHHRQNFWQGTRTLPCSEAEVRSCQSRDNTRTVLPHYLRGTTVLW
eukprot:m.503201 g.503201  ORF g.503201 m.503201 type:complete len:93 (-) comp70272_c0_seq1:31-309(-)